MPAAVSTSGNECATLTLIDPLGNTVSTGSNCGTAASVGPVNITIAGTYEVSFEVDPAGKGGGTLWVSSTINVGTVTVNSSQASMNPARFGQGVTRTFTGQSGQRITAVVNAIDTSDNGCETLALLDPKGNTMFTGTGCGSTVSVGPVSLPGTGTYKVRFEVDAAATGDGALWVSVPISVGTATVNGSPVSMNVTRLGQGVIRSFAGKVGQRVTTVVNNVSISDNGCESLTLLDPSGTTLSTNTNCGNGSAVGVGPINLTVAGTYQVRFEADPAATSTGTLWVSLPISVGTVTVNGASTSMNVIRVGQGVFRTFTGQSGHSVTVSITDVNTSDGGCESLTVLDPSGSTVASGTNCGNGSAVVFGPVGLTVSGTYQIRFEVDPAATGSGSLTLSG